MHGDEMSLQTSFVSRAEAEEECVWQRIFAEAQTWQTQVDMGNEPQPLKAEKHKLGIQIRG